MDERIREGEAYAVLTDGGELVFFRSEETYEDGEVARARDVLGNEYEGEVYSGIETKQWSLDVRPGWHGKHIKSVRIAEGQAIAPKSCSWWFSSQRALRLCDLEELDTSMVTDMSYMFADCHSLVSPPDTSGWDTSKVKDMRVMFTNCLSLTTPPDTSKWDTSSVEDMSYMFYGCESLKTPPDTSHWDTSSVTDMGGMFCECESTIMPPDTSKWSTSRVESMGYTFFGCESLATPPDTSKWDTSRVESMSHMFSGCESLVAPPDTSHWDTSSVTDMSGMFYNCRSLATPPDTLNWQTPRGEDIDYAFVGCRFRSDTARLEHGLTIHLTAEQAINLRCDIKDMEAIYSDQGRDEWWDADDLARDIAESLGTIIDDERKREPAPPSLLKLSYDDIERYVRDRATSLGVEHADWESFVNGAVTEMGKALESFVVTNSRELMRAPEPTR